MTDVLVLGSGVAGLTAARTAAEAGLSVTLLTKGELAASATRYAQGGVAAALSPDDSPELHFSDTVSAGGGLCDPEALRILVGEGPVRLRELMALGAAFDRTGGGAGGPLALAREGGHSLARVVHAGGDATGQEVERALVAATRDHPNVTVREGWLALSMETEGGRVAGVTGIPPATSSSVPSSNGGVERLRAGHVVLACGGAGQLYSVTTNPSLSTGDGVAMALAAGAAVADVEFMQFHPTALHHPVMPRPLLSEALRGEGAVLRDDQGVAFMAAEHPLADLAPRDVVSRAIARRLVDRGLDHLWLDATAIDDFARRFPTIWAHSRDAGVDPTREWLPVAPAAHYLCGGVVTDVDGAASIPGLWACGEVACTGIHGANRLASNSLLEGLVFGHRVGTAIAAGRTACEPTGAMRGVPHGDADPAGPANRRSFSGHAAVNERRLEGPANRRSFSGHAAVNERRLDVAGLRDRLQRDLTSFAGVLRDGAGLERAAGTLDAVGAALADATGDAPHRGAGNSHGTGHARGGDSDGARHSEAERSDGDARAVAELRNLLAVGRAVVTAATERQESRGCHHRLDHPEPGRPAERIVCFGDRRLRAPAALAVSEREG